MTDRRYPITVTARPSGVALDARPYAVDFLRDVLGLLREHPTLMDDLVDLVDNKQANDPHVTDKPSRDDAFITNVLASLPDAAEEIRVHGPALDVLTGTLLAHVKQQGSRPVGAVPPQRGAA